MSATLVELVQWLVNESNAKDQANAQLAQVTEELRKERERTKDLQDQLARIALQKAAGE